MNGGFVLPLLLFFNGIVLLVGQNLYISIPLSGIILILFNIMKALTVLIRLNYFKYILNNIDIKNRKESGDITLQLNACDMEDVNMIHSLYLGEKRVRKIQLVRNGISIKWDKLEFM
jgi:hypothetical protein